jgi:Flp pilus assembly protein TadD
MTTSRMAALEEILAREPNDATTHYMLGNEYFKVQMFDRAVATLRRYLALTDDEGAAYRTLAQSLLRLGRFDEARQAYRDGLAAATRHSHQPMIEEYTQALKDLD